MPAEVNNPPCPLHGAPPRSLHTHNFFGIVQAAEAILATVSGLGTTSYTRCPYGYPNSFEGVVRVLEDINATVSGLTTGSDLIAGSGVYISPSGSSVEVGVNAVGLAGADVAYSGAFIVVSGQVSTASAVVSGAVAGEGITVTTSGDSFVISTNLRGEGAVDFRYDGSTGVISGVEAQSTGGSDVVVSGEPGLDYGAGALWFDTNQGRLFVYASGNGVTDPSWYQTNTDAIVAKGDAPPSGTGLNAPPRDGSIWYSTLLGSLFVYDVTTSGWYEAGPSRSVAYGVAAPAPSVEGAGWYSTGDSALKIWDGSTWISV